MIDLEVDADTLSDAYTVQRTHTKTQNKTLVCACDLSRPKADECGGFRRLKLRQGAERAIAVGWILVSEGVEKGWRDVGRFDLSRKLFATGSDQRETMGDVEPRSATSLTR